ncbi:MAG: (2Fe-2S)-binding protein [Myxococcota bacterium]
MRDAGRRQAGRVPADGPGHHRSDRGKTGRAGALPHAPRTPARRQGPCGHAPDCREDEPFTFYNRKGGLLSPIAENPRLSRTVCSCEQVTEAEVRHCIRNELAGTLPDLWFRARLGMGPCHGLACAPRAAQILEEEQMLEPPAGHEEVARFLEIRWRDKYPAADGIEMAQEELARGIFIGACGYEAFREDDQH